MGSKEVNDLPELKAKADQKKTLTILRKADSFDEREQEHSSAKSPQLKLDKQHGRAVDRERRTTSKVPKNKKADETMGHLKALDSMLSSGPLEVNKEKGKKRIMSGSRRKQE